MVSVGAHGGDPIGSDERPESPVETDGAADFFRAIGKQAKLLRERAGLTQRELGDRLGYSEEQISSVERGRRTPQPEFLDAVDDLLEGGGLLKATKDDLAKAKAKARVRHPAWFRDYARQEMDAVELNYFSTVTVPGMLQTEAYARATFTVRQPVLDERTIEARVMARMARQEILTRRPAPTVTAVLDESVLRRAIGGRDIRRGQTEHLLQLGHLRNTTLEVLPMDCEDYAGIDGPFTLLTPKGRRQVAYVEVQGISRLITDAEEVRILAARYGSIRGQALTPRESLMRIEKMLGDE